MAGYEWAMLGLQATWLLFIFAFGACCGSLINVLVYRLPLGLDVMLAGSRCPACETPLTWRENIPVFGWVFLRGRCRFCKSRISAEYPLVELVTGLLFAGVYALWYIVPADAVWLGVPWGQIRPEWALTDRWDGWPRATWPMFTALILLLGSLVAMTLVDAKTFTIPLALPWFATVAGVLFHTAGGILVQSGRGGKLATTAPGWIWTLPTPGGSEPSTHGAWWWIGASFGGIAGIGLSLIFVRFGLIRRSFDDYAAWEAEVLKAQGLNADVAAAVDPHAEASANLVSERSGQGVQAVVRFTTVWIVATIGLGALVGVAGPSMGIKPWAGWVVGALLGPVLSALVIRGSAPKPIAPTGSNEPAAPDLWIAYPHARREMLKELIFLTPCLGLGWLSGALASHWAGQTAPLWLLALTGSLMGYLIGGGVVWAIRIGGSLAFGKEAMGLGDVHMMAAVGACIGWIDAALAVPLAAVVGLYCFVLFALANRPAGRAMPFGPYLAAATLLVILGKPLIELGLNTLLGANIPGSGIPSVNLP